MCRIWKKIKPNNIDTPKPLLELHNVTILEKCIQLIKSLGIKKILINTFYLKDHFPKFLKDKNSINNFPANGEASLSGILIEANLKNGLAQKVKRIIKGGSLV